MAEPTEHPGPGAPPVDRGGDDPVYKPLSLLAVAGFAVACLYALFLLVCTVVALFRWTPLLMPSYLLLFPFAGLVLSLLGYLEIRRSEDTRAGSRLAVWGMAVSCLSGLMYVAYDSANYLAVRQSAEKDILQFFEHLKRGETDEGFRMTLEPRQRPTLGEGLRLELEQRFNLDSDMSMRGRLSQFEQGPLMRMLADAGDKAEIRSLGLKEREFKDGGYKIRQIYQLTVPEMTVEFLITAHGREPSRGQGRQWTVVLNETGLQSSTPTPLGIHRGNLRRQSSVFLQQWIEKLREDKGEEAFLDTLAPEDRQRAHAQQAAALLGRGLLPPITPEARRQLLPGYKGFTEGNLVRVAPKFWAPEAMKSDIPAEVKKLFAKPGEPLARIFQNETNAPPLTLIEGDKLRLHHEFQIHLRERRAMAEVWLITECQASAYDLDGPAPAMRLLAIELKRGKTLPEGPPGMAPIPR